MELSRLTELAKEDSERKFFSIAHHLTPETLYEAFTSLRKDASAGVDGVTYREYEKQAVESIHKLHERLKDGTYRAQPLRRIYIEKEDGRKRPISIPSLEDKILQRATVNLLNAIYEPDFLDCSYGFRPGRGAQDALDEVGRVICRKPTAYVLELDITSYFDTIVREQLMEMIEKRISDASILRLLRKWINVGVIDDGRLLSSEAGTCEGRGGKPLRLLGGVTSVGDAGGGFQNYPEDYQIIDKLARDGQLTVRVAYNLFPQKPKQELADFQRWVKTGRSGDGTDFYKLNGAGEMLAFSAADFEDFLVPRPDMPAAMETDLEGVVRFLAGNGWPWRMHATYNETITRALNMFEKVHRERPIDKLGWFFDHCETVSPDNLERIRKLGGGIAIQNRMSMQGEYFVRRYGLKAASETPPVKRMLAMGLPVTLGTDATRVNSYNPWQALYWLVSGRSIGGTVLYPEERRLERIQALRLMTADGAWFSRDTGRKGVLRPGAFADVAVLDRDYLAVPEDEIQDITSVLTVVAGKVVHASGPYEPLAPPLPAASPDWSPVRTFGGYQARKTASAGDSDRQRRYHYAAMCGCARSCGVHGHDHATAVQAAVPTTDPKAFWGALGCNCYI